MLEDVHALERRRPRRAELRTTEGLAALLSAMAVVFVAVLSTYGVEALSRWRPWIDGDGVPVARMFLEDRERPGAMDFALGSAGTGASGRELDDAVAANLEEESARPAPGPERGDPRATPLIDPNELEGLTVELEDRDHAMDPFYDALLRTAREERGAITRIAHYGDSSIAGDGITSTLRRRMQRRFGDAGHGFHLIARGTMPYRHVDFAHRASTGWELRQLVRAGLRSHRYGYGGAQARGVVGDWARYGTADDAPVGNAMSRFELYYFAHPRGGRLDVRVDGGERVVISTREAVERDAWWSVDLEDGPHEIELRTRGAGQSKLYGVVTERDGPGVVYDSLGMVGARARRMLGFDPTHFRQQHEHRGTDLVVLGFGGNDADDLRTAEQFEDDFNRVSQLVREALPGVACLWMAPLDQARRDGRGRIETIPQVSVIVEAERRAAAANGCAFYDTFEAMGGDGAMRRWFRSHPRLAFGDLRHATPAGYRVVGNMFYKALLSGFAGYLRRARQTPREPRPTEPRPAEDNPAP